MDFFFANTQRLRVTGAMVKRSLLKKLREFRFKYRDTRRSPSLYCYSRLISFEYMVNHIVMSNVEMFKLLKAGPCRKLDQFHRD